MIHDSIVHFEYHSDGMDEMRWTACSTFHTARVAGLLHVSKDTHVHQSPLTEKYRYRQCTRRGAVR